MDQRPSQHQKKSIEFQKVISSFRFAIKNDFEKRFQVQLQKLLLKIVGLSF